MEFHIARKHAIEALRMYKERYQHIDVPPMFVVPPAEPWPVEMHRLPLGSFVRVIRKGMFAEDPEFKEQLNELGFSWICPKHQTAWKETEEGKTQRLRRRINRVLPNFYEFEMDRVSYNDSIDATVMAEDRIDLGVLDSRDRERYLFLRDVDAMMNVKGNPDTILKTQSMQPINAQIMRDIKAYLEEDDVRKQTDAVAYWIMRQYNLTESLNDYAHKLPTPRLNATMGLEPLDMRNELTQYERTYNPYKDTKNLRVPYEMAQAYKLNSMTEAMINSPIMNERSEGWMGFDLEAYEINKCTRSVHSIGIF